jgi:hypothetical protein
MLFGAVTAMFSKVNCLRTFDLFIYDSIYKIAIGREKIQCYGIIFTDTHICAQ